MQWNVLNRRIELETVPFKVERLDLEDAQSHEPVRHPYHRIICPDWVNILPITRNGQAVLIRQTRAGTLRDTLETPGGVIEAAEKDFMMAALREMEEETGYTSQRVLPLATINPNPALFNNRLHMFLALDCELNSERQHHPDEGEKIEVVLTPVRDLDIMVRTGRIDSCLVCLTITLANKYLEGFLNKP